MVVVVKALICGGALKHSAGGSVVALLSFFASVAMLRNHLIMSCLMDCTFRCGCVPLLCLSCHSSLQEKIVRTYKLSQAEALLSVKKL